VNTAKTEPPPEVQDSTSSDAPTEELEGTEKQKRLEDLLENFRASMGPIDSELFDVGKEDAEETEPPATHDLDVDGIQQSTERVLKNLKESMNSEFNFNPYLEDDTYSKNDNEKLMESKHRYQEATLKKPKVTRDPSRLYQGSSGPRSREARIKQLKSIMLANEKKSCSFKPEIKKLPGMYVQRDSQRLSLVDRLYAWDSRVRQSKEYQATEKKKQETGQCTFKPQLNKTSKLLTSNERQDLRNVSLRSQARAKVVEREIRRQQEQEHLKHCTFQPTINKASKQMVSRNRSLQSYSQRSKRNEQRVLEEAMKDCTFTPQINKVKKHMQAANLYLEMTPFERLSQPCQRYSNDETWHDEGGGHETFSLVTASKKKAPLSPGFLKRTEEHIQRKKKTVERHLEKERQEFHRPRLNKKSVKIVQGTFFERMKQAKQRRESTTRLQEGPDDAECTFSPRINIMSQNLKGRSAKEMSEGDYALKASKLELARMYQRKQELSDVTFRPERKTKNHYWDSMSESTLKISSEPHNFTERVAEMQARKEEKLRRRQVELEESELDKCTFKPKTKQAPEFVKRIAESVKAVKKNQKKKKKKAEWR